MRANVAGSNTHKEPPNQVLRLRMTCSKCALVLCTSCPSIVLHYSDVNDVLGESHSLFSRSRDSHWSSLFKSAFSLFDLKCCLLANRFCRYSAKKRSNCTMLSFVRMGNVDVILPVYMIFYNDMAFIALIPNGILLTGRVGYTGITFQRSSPLHIVVIINSSCII